MSSSTAAAGARRCPRCTSAFEGDRDICVPCAVEIRMSVGPAVMSELTLYWQRRLTENRQKDWT